MISSIRALVLSLALGLSFLPLAVLLLATPSVAQTELDDPHMRAMREDIEAYCTNIADAARDQRYLMQRQELERLQADIDERIAALEERRAEYEDWLTRRNDFLARAEDGLVEIYKGMRPDAAAERLEVVSAEISAAIIMKLEPRMAGEILNEMDTDVAAVLTSVIASAADQTTSRKNPS